MAAIFSFLKLRQNRTLNEQNHTRNNLVKTKSPYQFSLQKYVIFTVFKFKMAAIFLFLLLRQICRHTSGVECHKEHSCENTILISLFVNEICSIFENSKWPPIGHLGYLINMNFS